MTARHNTTNGAPMTDDMQHAEIRFEAGRGRVIVGGHDISAAVLGLTFRGGADQFPELELDLVVLTADVVGEALARTYLPDETKKALVALGWTPPPAEAAEDAYEAATKPGIHGGAA